MAWFSAKLLIVSLHDDGNPIEECVCDYPFVVFKAPDYEGAFTKAIELGKEQETSYKNAQGVTVRWAFASVEQIWDLGSDLNGKEVGSIMDTWYPNGRIAFDHDFSPKDSDPIFSAAE